VTRARGASGRAGVRTWGAGAQRPVSCSPAPSRSCPQPRHCGGRSSPSPNPLLAPSRGHMLPRRSSSRKAGEGERALCSSSRKQDLCQRPRDRDFWKSPRWKAFRVAQGTHLIDAGVRDVVFLEKGMKTPRMTVCSPPGVPRDRSLAHPARGAPPAARCTGPSGPRAPHRAPGQNGERCWRRAMAATGTSRAAAGTSPGSGATTLPGDPPAEGLQGSAAAG